MLYYYYYYYYTLGIGASITCFGKKNNLKSNISKEMLIIS